MRLEENVTTYTHDACSCEMRHTISGGFNCIPKSLLNLLLMISHHLYAIGFLLAKQFLPGNP